MVVVELELGGDPPKWSRGAGQLQCDNQLLPVLIIIQQTSGKSWFLLVEDRPERPARERGKQTDGPDRSIRHRIRIQWTRPLWPGQVRPVRTAQPPLPSPSWSPGFSHTARALVLAAADPSPKPSPPALGAF